VGSLGAGLGAWGRWVGSPWVGVGARYGGGGARRGGCLARCSVKQQQPIHFCAPPFRLFEHRGQTERGNGQGQKRKKRVAKLSDGILADVSGFVMAIWRSPVTGWQITEAQFS